MEMHSQLHALEAVPLGKEPLVDLEQEGEGPPSWSGRSSERKVGCPGLELNHNFTSSIP
jgi:hypothetical protein